ncbi:50S ribosomal protein L29 [Chlamydiifrater volucris]|uniref:50S ribosomal protein L29 n=1 Tax=Chlamydiifrater volucris TaxID=2681470 RepID=UPI001BCF1D11|nr:50S ribosomal protein L29 [Chlamydiifrater volucris]
MKRGVVLEELRAKSNSDLDAYIEEMKRQIFSLKEEVVLSNKSVKAHLFSECRKNIARALTIKQERAKGKENG